MNQIDNSKRSKSNVSPVSTTEKLLQIFSLYSHYWKEWQAYKHSGLSKLDRYVVNAQIENDFSESPQSRKMVFGEEKRIKAVTRKLKASYNHYQDWVVMRFQFLIINQLGAQNLLLLLNVPIAQLPLAGELKEVLLKFGSPTLENLFDGYAEREFKEPVLFGYILLYKKTYNELNFCAKIGARETFTIKLSESANKIANISTFTQFKLLLNHSPCKTEKTILYLK